MNLKLMPLQQAGASIGTKYTLASIDPRKNERSYAVEYLKLALDRPNLTVLPNATARKIVSSSASKDSAFVASGVEFLYDETIYRVHANREVVICAG